MAISKVSKFTKYKPRYVLAIDQGTTGTTVSLIANSGKVMARHSQDFRQHFPKPGWVEHKPEEIWKSVVETMQQVIRRARLNPELIAAVGITNQRETVVCWDRKTGKPVANAIVWQDRRTTEFCETLKSEGQEEAIRKRTGLVLDPYFSATKIKWLFDQTPSLRARAEKGEVIVGTVDTYLLWRLTGGVSHKTDVSNASRTMLMNLETCQWDPELLKLFDVPEACLPSVEPSSGLFGTTLGLKVVPDGIPITGIAGDQQAALFGQACFEVGEAKCTFGTGSFLLLNTGDKRIHSQSGLLTTVAWKLKGENQATYALEGGAFICGAAVQFLRDQLGLIKESKDIEKLAAKVDETGGVEFVPALTGLGAPYWDPRARGMISGLTRGTTKAHIARATLEAMALQNTDILKAMERDLIASGGDRLKSVRVDGGASANSLLMQIQADYLDVEVVRPKMIETTSLGAAFLAGHGADLFENLEQIKKVWRIEKTFKPKMSVEKREERFHAWQKAVSRVR